MFARSAATALLSNTAIGAMPVRQSSRLFSVSQQRQQQQQRRPFTLGPTGQPSQQEMNNMRAHLEEDMQWLPEALWIDGRRATMGELYAANPNMADLEIDEQLQNRNRKHPLHQGIKAALERRTAVLKQAEEEEGGWEYLDEAPEGLTDMQKKVYLELKKQAAPAGTDTTGNVLIKKTVVQGTQGMCPPPPTPPSLPIPSPFIKSMLSFRHQSFRRLLLSLSLPKNSPPTRTHTHTHTHNRQRSAVARAVPDGKQKDDN